MRRVLVSYYQPIRFARFDGKSVNRGLPVLDQARALDPCHRPEGSWALGTRMVKSGKHQRSEPGQYTIFLFCASLFQALGQGHDRKSTWATSGVRVRKGDSLSQTPLVRSSSLTESLEQASFALFHYAWITQPKRFCCLVSLSCSVHGQGQKSEQKHTTKNFVGFHNHSLLLTMDQSSHRMP